MSRAPSLVAALSRKVDYDSTFSVIKQSILEPLSCSCPRPISHSQWLDAYRSAFWLCFSNDYTPRVLAGIQGHLFESLSLVAQELFCLPDEALLDRFCELWSVHHLLAPILDQALSPVNSRIDGIPAVVPPWPTSVRVTSVGAMAVDAWCSIVLNPLFFRLVAQALKNLNEHRRRSGQQSSHLNCTSRAHLLLPATVSGLALCISTAARLESISNRDQEEFWGKALANSTREFYAGSSAGLLAGDGITMAAYSQVANRWLAEEEARALALANLSFAPPISSAVAGAENSLNTRRMYLACVEVLARPHSERLFAELGDLLVYQRLSETPRLGTEGPQAGAFESAGEIFRLLMRMKDSVVPGLEAAVADLAAAAFSRGLSEIIQPAIEAHGSLGSRDVLLSLLDVILVRRECYLSLARRAFASRLVEEALEKAAKRCLALLPNPAEGLVRYLDARLRKLTKDGGEVVEGGGGGAHPAREQLYALPLQPLPSSSEADYLDASVERALRLVRVLESKDEFQRLYTQSLCRRLLSGATSVDLEVHVLTRMTADRGYEYTRRMERLVADMVSADLSNGYAAWEGREGAVDVSVRVVASNLWPLSVKPTAVNIPGTCLPRSMQNARACLTSYYASIHGGRRLTWLDALSTVTARTLYLPTRQYDVVVTVYQLAVLLAFDKWPLDHPVPLQDISSCTGTPLADCQGYLSALVEAGLVSADPSTTSYSLVSSFASKRAKVRVSMSSQSEAHAKIEHSEDAKQLAISRQYELEASLVRILKTKKSLLSKVLFAEVASQLAARFVPSREMYKSSLERIIERGYAKRGDTHDIIDYVA